VSNFSELHAKFYSDAKEPRFAALQGHERSLDLSINTLNSLYNYLILFFIAKLQKDVERSLQGGAFWDSCGVPDPDRSRHCPFPSELFWMVSAVLTGRGRARRIVARHGGSVPRGHHWALSDQRGPHHPPPRRPARRPPPSWPNE